MAMATPLASPLHLSLVRSHRSRFPVFFTRSPSLNQFPNRVSSASSDGTGGSPISTSAAPAIQSQSRDSKYLDTDSTSSSSVAVHALTFQQAVQRLQMDVLSKGDLFPKIVEAYSRPTRIIRGKDLDVNSKEDETIRNNRLAVLKKIADLPNGIADLSVLPGF